MGGKKVKQYRRTVKRTAQRYYNKYISDYIIGICKEKFRYRIKFAWLVIIRVNPHSGEKVDK